MKNFWYTLMLVVAAAGASFGAFYVLNDSPAVRRAAREQDAMAWLRTEFCLDDRCFAEIRRLHDDYAVECSRHCAAIVRAKQRAAPVAEVSRLEGVCVEAMTAHFRRVAALMPVGQGERYLAIVLPRVADYDHSGAPNVQVKP